MHCEMTVGTKRKMGDYTAADYLRQEIAFFEARLNEMGETGDCAYEHALSRAYRALLIERKEQLARLVYR